jgi:hypothetical protein
VRSTSSRRMGRASGSAAASFSADVAHLQRIGHRERDVGVMPGGIVEEGAEASSLISTRSALTSSEACGSTSATMKVCSLPEYERKEMPLCLASPRERSSAGPTTISPAAGAFSAGTMKV